MDQENRSSNMNIKTLMFAGALTVIVVSGELLAQGCGGAAPGCASGNCGAAVGQEDVGYASYSGTGDASQGCSSCGDASGNCTCAKQIKEHWAHTKEINAKVCARNRAWPKPFDCADRQLYFSIWEPMIDAGFEKHCTLTEAHFDPETGDLNKYGQTAIAGIMQNMPRQRRTIFIHRDIDQQSSDQKMNVVRETVQTWYGPEAATSIAFTDKMPTRSSASRIETINRLYNDGTPPPLLPVATGQGGTK
jgi:hypothetical protein